MRIRRKRSLGLTPPSVSTRVDTPESEREPPVRPKGPGPNAQLTKELHALAVTAWIREGTIAAIKEATGLGTDTATRLLDSGIPSLGLPSLRDAARIHAHDAEKKRLAHERKANTAAALAAAKVIEEKAKERTKALKAVKDQETKVLGDATASRNDEIMLVRTNRQSALVLAKVNGRLLKTSLALADSLDDSAAIARMSVKEKLNCMRTIAGIVHRTALASQVSVNMERLLMGEPTAILGRQDMGPSPQDMSPEEAEKWLAIANHAMARKRARANLIDTKGVDVERDEEDAVDELVEDL